MAVGLAFVALVVAFVFLFIYDHSTCYSTGAFGAYNACNANSPVSTCNVPAIYETFTFAPNNGAKEIYQVTCGWRNGTSTMGYVALALSVVFVILCGLAGRVDSIYYGIPVVGFGILCAFGVITTFALMVTDINDGHYKPLTIGTGYNITYWTQVAFIISACWTFFVFLTLLVLIVSLFYTHIQKNYKQLVVQTVVRDTIPIGEFQVHNHQHR